MNFMLDMLTLIGGLIIVAYALTAGSLAVAAKLKRWRQGRAFEKLRRFDELFGD